MNTPALTKQLFPRRILIFGLFLASALLSQAAYRRMEQLAAPKVVAATDAVFLTGSAPVENLTDGNPNTEYASAGAGLGTFVEFDFGHPVHLAGFRHQDRRNGTIAGSELTLYGADGREVGRVSVVHPDRRSAVVFQPIDLSVPIRKVRWQVTKLGVGNSQSVGGAEVAFFTPGPAEAKPTQVKIDAVALPVATQVAGRGEMQPLRVTLESPYANAFQAYLRVGDEPVRKIEVRPGPQMLQYDIPVAEAKRVFPITLGSGKDGAAPWLRTDCTVPSFRRMTIYILPHSHVDIGFTELQTGIEEKQLHNLLRGMAEARRTADYPAGSRFVWNLEGLWPADLLQRRLDGARWQQFINAVRSGQVALNGFYFNTLTGLCRPEELTRVFKFGTRLAGETGTAVDSAMISDVPGYTWGTVTAMAQAGIKYFSAAPNIFDRIGDTYVQWENKPFWWVGPSGKDRVLVWVPLGGYNLAARLGKLSADWVEGMTEGLVRSGYAYDVMYIRWSRGDNAEPDETISDQVRAWNTSHAWPRFVIGSVHEAFADLEKRSGDSLPEVRGDWTPYWVDGAGSSARETAMNRTNSDRLSQAETLWAMRSPRTFPAADFDAAWRQVHLYDEHTWGASVSVTHPDSRPAIDQWQIKQSRAVSADSLTRNLQSRALALHSVDGDEAPGWVDVINTTSWSRTDIVLVPRHLSLLGGRVVDDGGHPVPSQRLSTGELAVLAQDVPAFGSRRYHVLAGSATTGTAVTAGPTWLDNGRVRVEVDPATGAITSLRESGGGHDLVDRSVHGGINAYWYFNGDDPAKGRSNGPVRISIKERGAVLTTLAIESSAPGAYTLKREITLTAAGNEVQLADLIDKERLQAASYRDPAGKESVNFAFPFNVPDGQVRIQVPYGVVRPDLDQIPGACKNWFTVNRWADVSNAERGITLVSLDTPLLQVGGMTAHLLNSQTNPAVWRHKVGPTQQLYVWAMNNHWGTNYRAYQAGPVTFRFVLAPHRAFQPAEATHAALAASMPLLVKRVDPRRPAAPPLLQVDSPDVVVTMLKPSDDGRGLLIQLWSLADHDSDVKLRWPASSHPQVYYSGTGEQRGSAAGDDFVLPARAVVTLRAEFPAENI